MYEIEVKEDQPKLVRYFFEKGDKPEQYCMFYFKKIVRPEGSYILVQDIEGPQSKWCISSVNGLIEINLGQG